ncbi:MAG TPA: hypothetical protein VJ438_00235, partial [Candidatus Nanoarchaeia archaeon]|nr:hypothetical protein [Candidatus Nanoarchaeia archaeon]
AENIGKLSRNLFYLFKNQSIDSPKYSKLEDELKGLQVVEKSYGWRIDHSENTSSDITMGLGMASVVAMERGIDTYSGRDLADLGFLNQKSIFKSSEKRDFMEKIEVINEKVDVDKNNNGPKVYSFSKRQF